MSEQAIEEGNEIIFSDDVEETEVVDVETDEMEVDETEVEEVETEIAAESEDDGEIEIVADGDDEPTPQPRGKKGYQRLVNRLKAAKGETAEEARQRELLEEENKLLRMKLEQGTPKGPPKLEDFDTDADYYAAKTDYDTEQARIAGREEAAQIFAQTQSQATQAAAEKERERLLEAHYERLESVNIPDYDQLEESLMDVMGENLVTEIMANTDKSHLVIPYLAANPGKAERFAQMSKSQPVKCLLEIGALANSLKVQRKHSRPADPETTIDKGIAADKTGYLKGVRFE